MSFLMKFLYKMNCCVEEHLKHLRAVFTILREHKLYAKLSKYEFGQPQIDSWGHIISGEGLAVDPSEIESMTPWPTPTSVKSLRGVSGFSWYYRTLVRNSGKIAKPLTDLLKKGQFK
jgi:hypothetical protein